MKKNFSVVVVLGILSLTGFAQAAGLGNQANVDSALAVITGSDSRVSKALYRRIASAPDWRRTWLEHLGLTEDTIFRTGMEIDFDRCIVVAVFGGDSFNTCGYKIEAVHENENTIVVRFCIIGYQTAGPGGGAQHVMPYAFVLLPKTKKAVVLEEITHSLNPSERPSSREVARLTVDEK